MSGATPSVHPWASWGIVAVATTGVIARPFGWPEWIWACLGAALLVLLGLLPWSDALAGVSKGTDVYLFLIGMMVLAELARREKLFDWLAAHAARHARGSAQRLFALVYGVGVVVTVFLSNDATAVVLTPAVAAVARAAEAEDPLPYLFTCAFVANAASFVLPISNPANLVIYGQAMPPLLEWAPRYALPSALSIGFDLSPSALDAAKIVATCRSRRRGRPGADRWRAPGGLGHRRDGHDAAAGVGARHALGVADVFGEPRHRRHRAPALAGGA